MPYSTPKFDYHFFDTPCITQKCEEENLAESQIRKRFAYLRFCTIFRAFQIILKLEICAEKIVFNCSTLKKTRDEKLD